MHRKPLKVEFSFFIWRISEKHYHHNCYCKKKIKIKTSLITYLYYLEEFLLLPINKINLDMEPSVHI
jgi:hypothetical protein